MDAVFHTLSLTAACHHETRDERASNGCHSTQKLRRDSVGQHHNESQG